jgi:ABC-2 family transporter protein
VLWVTWRQHRTQLLATASLLLALGAFLWWNGSQASSGLNAMGNGSASDSIILLGFLPLAAALIGLFWGVPILAREFERGTHRLAWTQSVSRGRWLAVKVGVLGLAVTLGGLALGGMVRAWLAALGDESQAMGDPIWFTVSGVAPAAWWLFMFALGTAAGALLRRTLPAMAATLAVFAVTMYLLITYRPDYATPERVVDSDSVPAQTQSTWEDAWIIDVTWQAPDGREAESLASIWPGAGTCPSRSLECVYEQGYREVVYFHPASRYWQFQWTESAILLGGVLVLAGVTAYRMSRRG